MTAAPGAASGASGAGTAAESRRTTWVASGAASPARSALDPSRNARPPTRVPASRSAAADGVRRKRRSERTASAAVTADPSWKRACGASVSVHSRPSAAAVQARASEGTGAPPGSMRTSVSWTSVPSVRSASPGALVGSPCAGRLASAIVISPP